MAETNVENARGVGYELGTWVGRRQAFATLAGSCSAADAECLRQVRERKQYRQLGMNWEEFCQQRLGICRKTAEQIIERLEEFGPHYFTLAQLTGVTPGEFRRIAGSVSDQGLRYAGETIPFAGENAPRLIAAVGKLEELGRGPVESRDAGGDALALGAKQQERALERAERLLRGAVDEIARLHALTLAGGGRERLSAIVARHLRRLPMAQVTEIRLG